jgi:TetR/AcrR family transcriptional repressor of nem operon
VASEEWQKNGVRDNLMCQGQFDEHSGRPVSRAAVKCLAQASIWDLSLALSEGDLQSNLLVGRLRAMENNTAVRIRKAAHDLIAERGYFGFSYADVAEAVGIRKASIHHHFPSKVDLVVATLKEHREKLVEAAGNLDSTIENPLQRIELYVQYWAECVKSSNRPICIAALLSAELPALPEEIQIEVRLHFKYLVSWIKSTLKAGARRGDIHLEHSAEVEAQSFVALVHGAMISARALASADIFNSVTKCALGRLRPSK